MSAARTRRVRAALAPALALALLAAAPSAAEQFLPPSPDADQPLYQPTRTGMEHFVQDELERLVAGQSWAWGGAEFEVVRLHKIRKAWVTRARQANRDYSAAVRGWAVAVLHVEVDGQLKSARVECNASYVWQPGGWAWEQVLLYLGNGDSFDLVTGEIK